MALLRVPNIQGIFFQTIVCYSHSLLSEKTFTSSRFGDFGRELMLIQVAMRKKEQMHSHDRESLNAALSSQGNRSVAPDLLPPDDKVFVEFGVLVKKFYGIDFAASTFTADIIIATRWTDKRNVDLIPAGEENLRLGSETASGNIWTPNIEVTNFAQPGVSPISTSFLIEPSGVTTKVERELLAARNSFEYNAFPFDEQLLEIRIASGTYMDDQVVLAPISNASYWGASASLFHPWKLVNTSISAVVDVDAPGLFSKSRGILQLMVVRPVEQFGANVFGPSIVLVAMSWSSNFLSLAPPFAMPRVALNAIALLAQVTLANNVQSLTPQGSITWLDKYLQSCFLLQLFLLLQNIAVLSLKHSDQSRDSEERKQAKHEFADSMSQHQLWFFPAFWAATLLVIWFAPFFNAAVIFVLMSPDIAFHIWDYRQRVIKTALEESTPRPSKSSLGASKPL